MVPSRPVNGAEPTPSARSTERAKRSFQANFRRELARWGGTIAELADRSGVDLQVLRRWRREGVAQPEHDHIERIARVFGIEDPWSLMEPGPGDLVAEAIGFELTGESAGRRRVDRATNAAVEEARHARPELFGSFSRLDWDELYSLHATGGALTLDGVFEAARKINEKRELRRKFEAVLETHHFRTLATIIEVLYRDTDVP